MNTRFTLVIPGMNNETGSELTREAERIVGNWEASLSRFRSGAELQIINALAFERDVEVSISLSRVLDTCEKYHRLTEGLFDPAVSKFRSGWSDLIRDPDRRTIRFRSPQIQLDMGGIGKGIAMEEVVFYLQEEGVRDAFLSFGESSIAGMGRHPQGDGWLVGSGEGFLLRDEYLSVSGLQELGGNGEDSFRAHIFHPVKGELISAKRRVMVKCDSPVEAEVLSTCGYMADEKEFEQLKRTFPSAEWRIEQG